MHGEIYMLKTHSLHHITKDVASVSCLSLICVLKSQTMHMFVSSGTLFAAQFGNSSRKVANVTGLFE